MRSPRNHFSTRLHSTFSANWNKRDQVSEQMVIHFRSDVLTAVAVDTKLNVFTLFALPVLRFDQIPLYGVLILSIGGGLVAALIVHFFVSPYLKKKIVREVYGDEDNGTASSRQDRTVSFTKGGNGSENGVTSDEKNPSGRYSCRKP